MSEETVDVRLWVRRGVMMVNAECLEHDDPDHIYNQILAQGKDPELFGYEHPLAEEFDRRSRSDLIKEIIDLRRTVEYLESHYA